ncbi:MULTISPECIES: major capsid protein [unclassified Rhodococcus (in: high G+C Gram-positive bacteria)]|uniref:major capsid protein n=1 Tax=unclassified Rhodococcus (in: high G+C Gram-positive bacteria) TaxID=192944 RepID=UPI000B9ABDFE|nr:MULTISPECIES: major capsid protein [unclassified Rhodococcus (in: high G+C Gram-positive bacteria)]OZE31522.1 hypothetical protein CH259_25680 [Rhodococcus sp. 05-2254-4]OZE42452.1 hypothetical protein CH261_20165 [Rhodococcus sp. 05-2254-3]OZE46608.1 hypothetical protein CH283_19830 [Rhodococcus sp. 05-2254-2]
MPSILQPTLSGTGQGQQITVPMALQRPELIAFRVAELAEPELVLDKFFTPGPAPVGGSYLFVQAKAADKFLADGADVEARTEGSEYPIVDGVDPDVRQALVEDFGGAFPVTDAQETRNLTSYLNAQVQQLTNSIVRKLNKSAMDAVEAVIGAEQTIAGQSWENLVIVGPADSITPAALRPSADISAARLHAELKELGTVFDLLVVHPNQAHALRSSYGEQLDAMLKSADVELFSTPRITAGTAFVVQKGGLGKVGFETPLTVETIPDRRKRQHYVQGYANPYFAPEKPDAVVKIIGLEG